MICVQCKNEKWNQDICPHCGLGEKAALLIKADQSQKSGNIAAAIECYEKYLLHDPQSVEVLMGRAKCLYQLAVSRREESLFDKAEKSLVEVLKSQWDWASGHQLRVDLFFYYNRLDELSREYEGIETEDDSKREKALEVLKIIQLTKKFKENPPDVFTDMDKNIGWFFLFKSFLPLILGLPVLLWLTFKFAAAPHSKEESNIPALFFVLMITTLAILLLIYVSMRLYKRNRKKEENRIA